MVLSAYDEPARPSEVARLLGMPANTVHYWTQRLLKGGLLKQVAAHGRIRTYKSLVESNDCRPDACAPFIKTAIGAVSGVVIAAAERHDLDGNKDDTLLPDIGIHELRIRPSDVAAIVAAMKSALPDVANATEENGDGDAYTVAFIVTPGRVSDYF